DKYPTIYAKMEKIEATKNLSDCTIKVKYVEKYSTRLSKKEVEIFENDIYCGKPITPIYTVKDAEGNLLKEGVDFTAEYSNNINAGKKAKIKLTGKGIYKGTKTAAFTIKKLQLSARRSTGSGDIFFADVQQNLKNMDAYEENGYRYYVHSGKTIKPDICKVYVFKAGKEYDIPLSNFTLEYPKKSKEIGGYEVKLISTGENIVINDRYTGDYLSSSYYIVPPTQHIRSAKIEKSGKYKGQLIVYFDPSGDYNVEIKVSMGKKFASDETLTFKVEGKGFQSKYIKLDKNWDKATKYIKVRYYKTGYWYAGGGKTVYTGKWSGVTTIKP
ncbi:MAG: hypothetical protein ILP10_00145, partial [Lachnospiraceae bacterium]|nr:hypothetical protein [Lachnospiraceae bacterium]